MIEREQAIEDLEAEIEEIKRSLPAHSVPPAMLLRLEELEEQREELLRKERDAEN
jgi:hypothetical protein